jgi:nucleoside 2-deoxyribosyltransferase
MGKYRIYCSGPLFCAEEVGGMRAIADVLEKTGFQTFLPHRDGIEAHVMRFGKSWIPSAVPAIRKRVDYAMFSMDVYELIEGCDGAVCNLNGRVPDEGMIVEASLAFAAGKPLVLFKDDVRAPFGGYDNSMLTGLTYGRIVGSLKEIPEAIKEEISRKKNVTDLSDDLKKAIAYGKRISNILHRLPETMGKKQWPEDVLNHVMDEASKS